jgi:hypothetical protein
MVKCGFENCGKRALFNAPGELRGRFCKKHSLSGHTDVINRRCAAENCNSISPAFNEPGQKQGKFCRQHALENYIDVKSKRCAFENCNSINPIFNEPGNSRGKFCRQHALETHVAVKSKRCASENCNAQPTFNEPGLKQGKFCRRHAPETHVDVLHKLCAMENCKIHPSFNEPGQKTPKFCRRHALETHVDVVSKRCAAENCNSVNPVFNEPGNKRGKFCRQHAPETHIDVKNKRCIAENCNIQATFGLPGYAPDHCAAHKDDAMIADPTKIKAEKKACEYCATEIHYAEKFCSGCKHYQRLGKTVKLHEKELTVKSWLEEKKLTFIHDRIVDNKCSRKRPDFFIQTVWGAIILEVDEHQHISKTYGCDCELIRMRQIYMDAGMSKVLFIRYNPDKYESEPRNATQPQRKEYVLKFLMRMTDDEPKDNLSVCYLFYDHFVSSAPEIEKINAY